MKNQLLSFLLLSILLTNCASNTLPLNDIEEEIETKLDQPSFPVNLDPSIKIKADLQDSLAQSTFIFIIEADDQDGEIVVQQLLLNDAVISTSDTTKWLAVTGDFLLKAIVEDDSGSSVMDSLSFKVIEKENSVPTLKIILDETPLLEGNSINIVLDVNDADGTITKTSLYIDNTLMTSTTSLDWIATLGIHTIKGVIEDNQGSSVTDSLEIEVIKKENIIIEADNEAIIYTGRIDYSNPKAPSFCFPGISIKTNFTGTFINLLLEDFATGGNINTNYYQVILDNSTQEITVEVNANQDKYELFSDLENTNHTIEIVKRTECMVGKSTFKGFEIGGNATVSQPTSKTRNIEFIGDSQTCGYGNEVSYDNPSINSGFNAVNENAYKAWGAITANNLNANYQCVAYSGRGMYRNVDASLNGTLPKIYNRIFANQSTPLWNINLYTPDVIVINLGTNDYAQNANNNLLNGDDFVNTYTEFVTTIRENYPNAKIICVNGVMMSDYFPANQNVWTTIKKQTAAVVKSFNDNNDTEVYHYALSPQSGPYGEDWHPTLTTHQRMAEGLTSYIQTISSW
ncbi:SGNH/GDSL hydrolase family protein [Flammeovirga pectinis]|nr:SGNH/GDSL hydrolase family protein [Flammeovirga pectinis]